MTCHMILAVFLLLSIDFKGSSLDVKVAEVKGYNKIKEYKSSTLYQVQADTDYAVNPLLVHLVGSRYDMGYAYGYMLSKEIDYAYHALLTSLIGDKFYDKVLQEALGLALDWQWNDYLSKEVPSQYISELKGIADGAKAAGCEECGKYTTRAIVLANAPGDNQDWVYVLLREFHLPSLKLPLRGTRGRGMQCSMFAVWGSRTAGSKLFSARNLDWTENTGINKNKMILVMVPNDGGKPSVTLGFVGLFGTLAGMSAAGLTVHEANLEENVISFSGFPWTIRLRYIMEYAGNLMQAKSLWSSTNNTVGFNHMVASAPDAAAYTANHSSGPVALALETMYMYTAYFADDDEREAAATMVSKAGQTVHFGFPMKEAVWRTNHGYDPKIRAHYMWNTTSHAYPWSLQRYMFIHDALVEYENQKVPIDYLQAINITAIAGDKGPDPSKCQDSSTYGSNVLSVTYQPQDLILYVAWERGSGDGWRPAACSTYVKLELKDWFNPQPPQDVPL